MKVRYDGGILVEVRGRRVLFDPVSYPSRKPDLIAISHAHWDHVNLRVLRKLKVPIVMSYATAKLISLKGSLKGLDLKLLSGERGEIEVSGIPLAYEGAGHIVGSLQYAILTEPIIAYTGDFNTDERVILKPAKSIESDVLIIEATYGDPYYTFPSRWVSYNRLLEKVGEVLESEGSVTIAGRSPGVAQEVIALLLRSKFRGELYVHPSALKASRVHFEEEGEDLNLKVALKVPEGGILIVKLSRWTEGLCRKALICTGWALSNRNGIPLSSHADFPSLVNYVDSSGAEEVYTVFGYSYRLAKELREMGYNSEPLVR